VTSRRTHGLAEDLLDDWGQLRVTVVFPPEGDARVLPATQLSSVLRLD